MFEIQTLNKLHLLKIRKKESYLVESVQEVWVQFEPGSVEEQTERRSVSLVVTFQIVVQEVVELLAGDDISTLGERT